MVRREIIDKIDDAKMLMDAKYSYYWKNKQNIINNSPFELPNIKLPAFLEGHKHRIRLSWGKKTIEKYQNELIFDYFEGDNKGYTYLIHTYYKNLLETVIKNTLLTGVSFLWVLNNDNSNSGSTVLFRDSGSCVVEYDDNNVLIFAISPYNDTDYIVYYDSSAHILKEDGTLTVIPNNTEVITFSIGREYGSKTIGKSIFTENFFEMMKNASSLLSLYSQATFLDVNNKNILLAKGVEPQMLEDGSYQKPVNEEISESGIKTLYASNSAELNLENLESIEADNFEKLLQNLVKSAAAEVFLGANEFGFEGDNPHYNDFLNKIEKIKEDLSQSIVDFAYIIMKNYTNDINIEEELTPKYKKTVPYSEIGAIGDALFKLNELDISRETIEEYTNNLLGLSKKKEKMQIVPSKGE